MSLTRKQETQLLDQVEHVRRQLTATIVAMEEIRRSREELGPNVSAFLGTYFTKEQWLSAHTSLKNMLTQLTLKIEGAQGDDLDKLRPVQEPKPGEPGVGGV